MLELAALAVSFGAILARSFHVDIFSVALIGSSLFLFLSFVFRTWRGALFSFALSLSLCFGAGAVWYSDAVIPREIFGSRAFDATVLSVDKRLGKTNLVVRDDVYNKKLQLSLVRPSEALPGDIISVQTMVEAPESFTGDSGRLFDYPAYLASKHIVGLGKSATVRIQQEGALSLPRMTTITRFQIADIFSKHVSFPVDGIVSGMTVGYQGGLPKVLQDLFRDTGVLHVLVLSGYNITLLAGFLGVILKGIPFRIRTILIICTVIMLVLVSGAGIASVRAGIMGTIALFAGLSIRTYTPLRALTISFLLFFALSPETIFADPGFHLSFLATAYMIFAFPKIIILFSFIPKTKGIDIRELLSLALTIPIFMLPYTMYFSGAFPFSAPLANIFLTLVAPILMMLGIATIVTSAIAPLAHLFGLLTGFLGEATIRVLEFCATFPIWNTPPLAWWSVTLFYILFFTFLFRKELMRYGRQLQSSLVPVSSSFDS